MFPSPLTKCSSQSFGKNRESCPFLWHFKMAFIVDILIQKSDFETKISIYAMQFTVYIKNL